MIRVMIVDDQASIRFGLTLQLRGVDQLTVIGTAADGQEAVELVTGGRLSPDVVLMDVRMPRMDGIKATRRLVQTNPGIGILMLTTFDDDQAAFAALAAGASGFLLKDATTAQITDAIRAVARGDAVLAPRITRALVERVTPTAVQSSAEPAGRRATARALLDRLSSRELEVLTAIGRGLNNAEIARTQHLAPSSVKTYVNRLLSKLDRRDRVDLVLLAHDAGLC